MIIKYANSIEFFFAQKCDLLKYKMKAEDMILFSDHCQIAVSLPILK